MLPVGPLIRMARWPPFKDGLRLQDTSILKHINEFDEVVNNHIQIIFPQLVATQILNSLVMRQYCPRGQIHFELIFHFFGYTDDTPEMRMHRIRQANLVGPAGFVSMEDTLATELVQFGRQAVATHYRWLTWAAMPRKRNRPDP